LSSLMIAADRGDRTWVAVPVFAMRRFFHTMAMVRRGSNIATPADLKGKRVGVPEYQQTAAIWSRGILEDYFDVSATEIEWFMERGPDRSHGSATGFQPPKGVHLNQIPPDKDIGSMLADGELDATLLYIDNRNLVDRSRRNIAEIAYPLFTDIGAEERRFYQETGLFPINHTLVIRRSLLERHPWIALNIYKAFDDARERLQAAASAWLQPFVATGQLESLSGLGNDDDPMAYGFSKAQREIEAIARYLHRSGLTSRQIDISELFSPSTLEL
jgi:4,5-dihydroxyphthalate decarboxylase